MATTAVITTSALGALEEALAATARNGTANTGCNSAQRRTASQLRCAACGYKGGKFRQDTLQTEDKTPFRYGTFPFSFCWFPWVHIWPTNAKPPPRLLPVWRSYSAIF